MKEHYKHIMTLVVLAVPSLFVLWGGYLQEISGHVLLFMIQGYVAWFLLYKAGQPFFGYSVTMSLGAYGTIVLTEIYHWPILLSMVMGSLMSCVVGVGIFLSTCRAKGFYVGMASFLLAILFPKVIDALKPITGGRNGLYFDGIQALVDPNTYYVVLVVCTLLIVGFLFWLMTTRTGQILTLIAENDDLAQTVGINTMKYKVLAYGIMGLLSGFGGALYVNFTGFISSVDIEVFTTIYIYFIPLLGGRSLCYGPLLGTLIVILLPDIFSGVERYQRILFGLIFVLVLVFLPEGVGPSVERYAKRLTQGFRRGPVTAG
ncbi:MAG: branched-chain amino acid ABC transporter permease [Deltaproteobacteria bacterium]|nr:branched-chain amino acid ABC transporter permease [Deltaproteobacteria bacterium]MBW2015221.1 branched-chain amino acid ABC transporter permease [Deltaproteobacteria bacterium]MBW2129862.1 branched-chain amino acid ABC transporter permease [Deltaproteobacteria bacterium]MBW2302378.1 branched-chain amino acid ABC transporter permease [Deltaproteobacteria bacterium]